MNSVTWLYPAPSCTIPALHPARAHIPASHTDVSKTWEQHKPIVYTPDDYDLTDRPGYLEQYGAFK